MFTQPFFPYYTYKYFPIQQRFLQAILRGNNARKRTQINAIIFIVRRPSILGSR